MNTGVCIGGPKAGERIGMGCASWQTLATRGPMPLSRRLDPENRVTYTWRPTLGVWAMDTWADGDVMAELLDIYQRIRRAA